MRLILDFEPFDLNDGGPPLTRVIATSPDASGFLWDYLFEAQKPVPDVLDLVVYQLEMHLDKARKVHAHGGSLRADDLSLGAVSG